MSVSTGQGINEDSDNSDTEESNSDSGTNGTTERKRVSVKDFALLVTLATIAASGLVTAVFGYDALVEKCTKLDLLDISITLLIFVVLIGTFTYVLVRMAAHYIVYLGIGVLIHLIFPLHRDKARNKLQQVFNKKDKAK